MEFIWKKEYEIGVREIDNQHIEIFNMLAELNDAINANKPKEILDGLLESVLEVSKKHFDYEENLLKSNNYKNIERHAKLHDIFEKRIQNLIDNFEKGKNLSKHLADFLEHWLVHHIDGEDRKFVDFLHKKGIH